LIKAVINEKESLFSKVIEQELHQQTRWDSWDNYLTKEKVIILLPKERAHFPPKAKEIKEKYLVLLLPLPISHVYSANFVICMVTLSRIVVRNRPYKTLRPISKLVSSLLLVNN
jgi:hypothetical protein